MSLKYGKDKNEAYKKNTNRDDSPRIKKKTLSPKKEVIMLGMHFPMILTTKHTGSQINTQSHLSRWKIIIMIICTIQAPQNKKLEKILQAISTTIAMFRVN